MGKEMVEVILELYDEAKNPDQIIEDMAKMYNVKESEIRKILKDNGRLPRRPYHKKIDEEVQGEKIPMPDIVKDLIAKELEQLETEIQKCQERKKDLEARYKTIIGYLEQQ